MCSMDQIRTEHHDEEIFSKLVSFVNKKDLVGEPSDEDIMTGFELFHAVVYCPLMDMKLFQFVGQLLSYESARTILLTFVNLFHSAIMKDKKRMGVIKEYYGVLVTALNLQYGDVLLATSTKSQIQAVIDNDWPFFTNHTDLVKTCVLDSDCDSLHDVFQKLGKSHNQFF